MLFNKDNITPLIPPEFGVSGVLRGSVSSFFGYLGFDSVCVVAGEAINAERNLPLSIMITLGVVTSLYVTSSLALVGMQDYTEISPESGYPEAFYANGVEWASQLTAVSIKYVEACINSSSAYDVTSTRIPHLGRRSHNSTDRGTYFSHDATSFAICIG